MTRHSRRTLLLGGLAASALANRTFAAALQAPAVHTASAVPTVFLAVKYPMVQTRGSMAERFALLAKLGYDGVEMESPNSYAVGEVAEASRRSGLFVHGVVGGRHWEVRLTDPDAAKRERALNDLKGALRDVKQYGGSSVLLVPGVGTDGSPAEVRTRALEGIRAALPVAARLGVHILLENVWNRFLYDHDGDADQTAEPLRDFIDEVDSPWFGSYFDIGNHQKYGKPANWIRTLGRRIVKLDVKDWSTSGSWTKIGQGEVDWAEVRRALVEIGFCGWATAEVGGGEEPRLVEILRNMQQVLRGA